MATKQTKPKHSARRIIILAATFALLVSMALVSYATGLLSDMIAVLKPAVNSGQELENMYGNGIKTDKPYMEDYQGNPIARPDMERIALDAQAAEDMAGAYVSTVEGSFTVDRNRFCLCTFMIDESGMGALTWTIENPNGIYYKDLGYGMVDFGPASPFSEPTLIHHSEDKESFCDSFTFLIRDENSGKKLHLVTYFGTAMAFTPGDALTWQVSDVSVQIEPVNYMPAKSLNSENGMRVYATYQGMILDAHSETEIVPHKIEIQFADGTKYLLMDNEIYNLSGSMWRKEGNITYNELVILFNRLIDPEEITAIEFEYTWRETVEHNGALESILHTELSTFLP